MISFNFRPEQHFETFKFPLEQKLTCSSQILRNNNYLESNFQSCTFIKQRVNVICCPEKQNFL